MSKNEYKVGERAIYDARELGTGKMIVLGLQHMFAMFGATVVVPLITGLNVSTTLLFAGLGTLRTECFHDTVVRRTGNASVPPDLQEKSSRVSGFFICISWRLRGYRSAWSGRLAQRTSALRLLRRCMRRPALPYSRRALQSVRHQQGNEVLPAGSYRSHHYLDRT